MKKTLILFSSLLIAPPTLAHELRLEGAVMDFSRNEIAIPGDSGNLFDVTEGDWKQKNGTAYRLYYTHQLNDKSSLRVLFAPLQTSFEGSFSESTNFNGQMFSSGDAKVKYKFNSYRLGYHREWIKSSQWQLNYGVVAKVRDAKIEVSQGGVSKSRSDLGLVPLLHFDAQYQVNELNSLYFDVDGLAAPQGRAIDAGLFIQRRILTDSQVFVGYRILEGGVDNDKVKNFSFINFYTLGLRIKF